MVRRPVVDYRKWLDTRGGDGPFGPIPKVPAMPKEEIVNRKAQHTDHCVTCKAVRSQPAFCPACSCASW